MKCGKCHQKNIKKANYCQKCGYPFSQEEKEQAAQTGLLPWLKRIKLFHEIRTLEIIKDNPIVKIVSVLLVFIVGLLLTFMRGNQLKILENKTYQVKYYEKNKEYYLFLNSKEKNIEKITAELYVPNRIEKFSVKYYDEKGILLSEKISSRQEKIELKVNTTENNYYVISDRKDKKDQIKVYVFHKEEEKEKVLNEE